MSILKVAIFDFDGTLYPKETFPLMMKHLKAHPAYRKKYRHLFMKILPVYCSYKLKLYPEQKMKEYSMRSYINSFQNCSEKEINQFFLEVATKMENDLSTTVIDRIKKHQEEGYYVMLVSGAFVPLLTTVTKELRFNSIVGTKVPIKNNHYDKKTPVIHIHGSRKKDEIFAHLANDEIDWENSYAYGDSIADIDVLELVGNPVAVKPEQRLAEVAKKRQWEIL